MLRTLTRPVIVAVSLLLMLCGASALAATVTITISPTSGTPGNLVNITAGNGSFAPNETVSITYDGTLILSVSANGTGALNATITVPPSATGSHIIVASGSANSGSRTYTVIPGIVSSRSSGIPGSSLTVSGVGFAASETGIVVTYDGTQVASGISADSKGSWNTTITVPASASGSHTIDASGASTLASFVLDLGFVVTPGISSSRASAAPGTSITITGAGFGASETGITVAYDGVAVASGVSANSKGGWTVSFAVPASPAGAHTIDAYGSATSANNVPDITFMTSAGIAVSRASAPPGSSITISGTGFAANETGITVTYDDKVVASGVSANPQGAWSVNFVVPASSASSHTIDAYSPSTPAASVLDVTFTVSAGISANRPSATPGTSITVTGSGFGAGETGITVTFDDKTVAMGITANSQGGWTATFIVPASAAGAHIVDAGGSATLATAVTDLTMTVTPGIFVSRPNAAPGTSLTVTGAGFGPGETGIKVIYDDKIVASGVSADAQGSWSTTFIVPASPSGSHSISAQGTVTQLTKLSEEGLSVGAGIIINPVSSHVGATVDISGSGFASGSPLKFTFDGKELPAEGAITDEVGSFNKWITIPQSPAGSHTIKVADGQNNSATAVFTMENTPPPTPALLSPVDGDRLGVVGDITPVLKWSGVTDDSGVTYTLQIDTDPDFSHPILEKKGILGTRYTLTKSEALARGEYYWRIKAVDGASNESAWATTWLLKSGIMPLSVLITIIVLLVAIAAGLAYFFGLRRRPRRYEGVPVPEAEAPRAVMGQWRLIEPGEGVGERPLPYRLALPESPKGGKTLSTGEMARLKVIVDFAQSIPLAEPGYDAKWLLDLAQNSMGIEPSTAVYKQLLGNELQVRYEPAWMRHPIFQDLAALLEGQPILEDLNAFVAAVNRCASEATVLLQEIYGQVTASEITPDFLEKGGWNYISAIYSDAMRWYLGKALRDPSERDYVIKPGSADEEGALYLWGAETSSFAEPLIRVADEKEAAQFRVLHLKLRRSYRNSDTVKQLADMMTQMAVERDKLSSAFSQFGSFTP